MYDSGVIFKPAVSPDRDLRSVEQPEPGGPSTSNISPFSATPSKSRRMYTRLPCLFPRSHLATYVASSVTTFPVVFWNSEPVVYANTHNSLKATPREREGAHLESDSHSLINSFTQTRASNAGDEGSSLLPEVGLSACDYQFPEAEDMDNRPASLDQFSCKETRLHVPLTYRMRYIVNIGNGACRLYTFKVYQE